MSAPDLLGLTRRVSEALAGGAAVEAIVAITESILLPANDRQAATRPRQLARAAALSCHGASGSVSRACAYVGTSPRTLWRAIPEMSADRLEENLRHVWHSLFHFACRRFGLAREGFDVIIDEHQTPVFGRTRSYRNDYDDEGLTEVGQIAGISKKDKYSGKFRALTYQVMVARFRRSGIILPLDIFLTTSSPSGKRLRVSPLSPTQALDRMITLLDRAYPTPRTILFDRGYSAHVSFAKLYEYCARRGARYLTPAIRDRVGSIKDSHGTVKTGLAGYIRTRERYAIAMPNSRDRVWFSERPLNNSLATRHLVILYPPRGEKESPRAYYTNSPVPLAEVAKVTGRYSERWNIENWFKRRVGNFNAGRGHLIVRRMVVFMLAIVTMAAYSLCRALEYPKHDVRAVSRSFSMPDFVHHISAALERG